MFGLSHNVSLHLFKEHRFVFVNTYKDVAIPMNKTSNLFGFVTMIDTGVSIMHALQRLVAYKANTFLLNIHLLFALHGYTVFTHQMYWLTSVLVSVLLGVLPRLIAVAFAPLLLVFLYLFWCS